MDIPTTRFGVLAIEEEDLILFPGGLLGLEEHRRWAMLTDASNDCLAWLQSASDPNTALAVVSPHRFVPSYEVRLAKHELEPLSLKSADEAEVLVVVGRNERSLTLNLKAPLVVNLEKRIGRQVIASGDLPVRFELDPPAAPLRKTA